MTNIYDGPADKIIIAAAVKLKDFKELKSPEWVGFVKSGVNKERPVDNPEIFWYVRAASLLRNIYRNGPVGISKLRTKYGGKKNRGVKPNRFYKGGGAIIRHVLQQLEGIEFVKREKKGRVITPKGKSFLDKIAAEVVRKK